MLRNYRLFLSVLAQEPCLGNRRGKERNEETEEWEWWEEIHEVHHGGSEHFCAYYVEMGGCIPFTLRQVRRAFGELVAEMGKSLLELRGTRTGV